METATPNSDTDNIAVTPIPAHSLVSHQFFFLSFFWVSFFFWFFGVSYA